MKLVVRTCKRALILGVVLAAACDVGGQRAIRAPDHTTEQSQASVDQGADTRMDKFEWLASNSAPKGCPMRILSGDFYYAGGRQYIPPAMLHSGWGDAVSIHVAGPDQKPLPDSVEVLFFSYLENRLYHGEFALPRDSITRLFKEGFPLNFGRSRHGTYTSLVAGVAPGGAVAVWASGRERQVEVLFGHAQPADDLDWHAAMRLPPDADRHEFVTSSLVQEAKHDSLVRPMMQHVPVGRWAAYRTRYRWRPVFEGMPAPDRLSRLAFLNGELDVLVVDANGSNEMVRPAPSFLSFSSMREGTSYRVRFDEEQIAAAFARLGAGGKPVELVFTRPTPDSELHVAARSGTETVPLRTSAGL